MAIFGPVIPALGLAPDDGKEMPQFATDNVGPHTDYLNVFPYLGNPPLTAAAVRRPEPSSVKTSPRPSSAIATDVSPGRPARRPIERRPRPSPRRTRP